MRADARENLDRILAAAARLFAQDGADTSLKAIALEADVGIATLYRRFPTREDLVEATYRNETERLGRRADELLAASAADAVPEWFRGGASPRKVHPRRGPGFRNPACPSLAGAEERTRLPRICRSGPRQPVQFARVAPSRAG